MPAEVVIQEVAPGRATVTVDGWRMPGVRAVTVAKRVNDRDVVTVEIVSQRTTVLPAPAGD